MILAFYRLISFWIIPLWGVSPESLRYLNWLSLLAGLRIPFLPPQPYKRPRLLSRCLETCKCQREKWLRLLFLLKPFLWDLNSLVSHCPSDFLMASTRLKKKKKVSCPRFPVFSAGRQSMMNQSAITTREDALEGGFGYRSLHAWTQSWSCVLAGGATGGGGKCEVQKEC